MLNKIDGAVSRGSSELLFVMRFDILQKKVPQKLVTFEVSALAGKGLRAPFKWIKGEK